MSYKEITPELLDSIINKIDEERRDKPFVPHFVFVCNNIAKDNFRNRLIDEYADKQLQV